jgi:hypothetical protein
MQALSEVARIDIQCRFGYKPGRNGVSNIDVHCQDVSLRLCKEALTIFLSVL